MDINVKKFVKHLNNVQVIQLKDVGKDVIQRKFVDIYVKNYVILIKNVLNNHVKFKLELFVIVEIEIHLQNVVL